MSLAPPDARPLPLNALRAFESAARLGGFKPAADELCVTPGAVAQQVKQLEAAIGAALFTRQAQGVVLTKLGQDVRADVIAAFDTLSLASQRLRHLAAPTRLRIAALPAVAELLLRPWLVPLRDALPGLEVSVTALETPPNLAREAQDLSIFLSPNVGAGVALAGPDVLYPVCAPDLAARVTRIDDLMAAPHITDTTWAGDWPTWLAGVHPGRSYRGSGPSFSLYSMALAEAEAGAGVLIGHSVLVQEALTAGRLVRPVPGAVQTGLLLVLQAAPAVRGSPQVASLTRELMRLARGGFSPAS